MSNNDSSSVENRSETSINLSNKKYYGSAKKNTNAHSPNPMSARYHRAQRYMQAAYGTKPVTFNTTLRPFWIDDCDCFWYLRDVPVSGKVTQQYRLVDANTLSNTAAFDQTSWGSWGLARASEASAWCCSGETAAANDKVQTNG